MFEFLRPARRGVRSGAVAFQFPAQQDRAAADAIDAEDEIQQRAAQRHEPDDADPQRGGARVALVKQRVAGGDQGKKKSERNQKVMPDAPKFSQQVHRGPSTRQSAPLRKPLSFWPKSN